MNLIQTEAAKLVKRVMDGGNLDHALQEVLRAHAEFSPQQRGALQDLGYGTVRYFARLQFFLDRLLTRPLREPHLGYLMAVALYQLEFSKSAEHVIVDQAVRAAKRHNPATAPLVNAVLRHFLRQRVTLRQQADADPATRHAYPRWWVSQLQDQYGTRAGEILEAGNRHPPMTLRVNVRQGTAAAYLEALAREGMAATRLAPDALMLAQPAAVERLPYFAEGRVSVQDAGAQCAAGLLDARTGMRVLDACAAPGGKAAHLLERADIELVALDKDAARLQRVRQNLERLALRAELVCGDAADPQAWWDGRPFQRILADVPCSASGVVRRHPDIKWLRRPADIEGFAHRQLQIVQALWPLLAPGGVMLYATCSIFARENQQVIDQFLQTQADAGRGKITLDGIGHAAGQLLPDPRHDGFFYALLHKKN
ncbi:MAG: 16S rRNA (cytosine(967)-C(5))-methyltransferase RsmB [Gallionellaceae bacterium CG02_land_8_20_14_3_00_60_115]|nr:MAG: 16S rRNA (cytosine(967)-C(5))-methyltransferase RsmB [Gallionellaceae bacterium CG02_land_8_20_14_3_00_60_115]